MLPRIAIQGAWRFEGASLFGLRAQLATVHAHEPGANGYGVAPQLEPEPFARFAPLSRDAAPFVTVAMQLAPGPDLPSTFDRGGLFGVRAGGGALF